MKRVISVILSLTLLISALPACAEGDWFGSLFGDIMKEVTDIANEVVEDVDDLWNDMADVANEVAGDLSEAWNDVTEVTAELWNDVKVFASDAWEDVQDTWQITAQYAAEAWHVTSEALGDAAGDVAEFLTQAWLDVAATTDGTWDWMKSKTKDAVQSILNWVSAEDSEALESLKESFQNLLEKLGLDASEAEKVWNALEAYSDEHQVSFLSAIQLVMPYLVHLANAGSIELTEDVLSSYVNSILETLGVTNQTAADDLLHTLQLELSEI